MVNQRSTSRRRNAQIAPNIPSLIEPKLKGGARGLLRSARPLDPLIRGSDFHNLDVLPSDFSLRRLDTVLNRGKHPKRHLRGLLDTLVDEYDLVVLDCAPSISLVSENVFRAAGALCDVDIYQAITLPWLRANDLSEYFNYLKKKELQLRIVFSDTVSRYSTTAISNSRRQIISALAVASEESQRNRIGRKILKFVPKLNSLMERNRPSSSDLHAFRKSAKSLKYSLDIWQVCFGKSASAKDVSNRLQKTYRSLGDWHDLLLSHDSVDAFLAGEVPGGLTDSTAYAKFQEDLRQRAENCLATYERSKKPLHKSLKRLKPGFI